jgi:hypothetical protein
MAYALVVTPRVDAYNPSSVVLNFIGASSEAGGPNLALAAEEEELTSPGIDGRRYRTTFRQYAPFSVSVISDHATYAEAWNQKWNIELLKGRVADLIWTIAGTVYPVRSLHITDATAAITMGASAGPNATSGATAIVTGEITFARMVVDAASETVL